MDCLWIVELARPNEKVRQPVIVYNRIAGATLRQAARRGATASIRHVNWKRLPTLKAEMHWFAVLSTKPAADQGSKIFK
jgi:hypothetical protein